MEKPILIMGATSGIGRCAVDEALGRDLSVRAFSRSADDLLAAPNLVTVNGDARDAGDVARALERAGAVIYALGIKERLAMLWEKETLFSDSTGVLLAEMEKAGVRRLLAVNGIGAGRSKMALSRPEQLAHKAIFGKPYADKTRQEEMILRSDTDWTIVRPTILTNTRKTGRYSVLRKPNQWRMGLISRQDVAAYLIDAVTDHLDIETDVVLAR